MRNLIDEWWTGYMIYRYSPGVYNLPARFVRGKRRAGVQISQLRAELTRGERERGIGYYFERARRVNG